MLRVRVAGDLGHLDLGVKEKSAIRDHTFICKAPTQSREELCMLLDRGIFCYRKCRQIFI